MVSQENIYHCLHKYNGNRKRRKSRVPHGRSIRGVPVQMYATSRVILHLDIQMLINVAELCIQIH